MKNSILFLILFSTAAFGQSQDLTDEFLSNLSRYSMTDKAQQAYCYKKAGVVEGYQVERLERIASLTKLLTTFFASELTDLDRRFETKIYIADGNMHIAGGDDPYWEEEKILLLMQALNDLGYKSFKTVTFDDHFFFTDVAFESHADITPAHVKTRLTTIWNAKSAKYLKGLWTNVVKFATEENVALDKSPLPTMIAREIKFSATNPLANSAPQVFVHRSLPFHQIIKSMNVQSKNHVAQNIFRTLSKEKNFDVFMQEHGFDTANFKIYNGSGLPVQNGTRLDNLASCELILNVSLKLRESLEKHHLLLTDIIGVVGRDLGSLRSRLLHYPEATQAVLAKTGTLMQTSTLAGFMAMDELVPFAILNHTTHTTPAHAFQDFFVSRMFQALGEPEPLVYEKISIFPWDGTAFLEQGFEEVLAHN
jgi:D-alanyl-D-alanine carboxypeptidase/D-alanyl-D-alanine-endopeptidase (penicillin-binding protein 4)